MQIEFVGQSERIEDHEAANTSRLVNCYRVPAGAPAGYVLRSVLGQTERDNISSAVRAMGYGNGKSWAVGNGALYEVADAGTVTSRAVVADDANTVVSGNYANVTVTANGLFYNWNGTTLTQPSGQAFTGFQDHCYVQGYTVLTEAGGKRFQWSDLADSTTFDALDFAAAEDVDDNIVRCFELAGRLFILCETSMEIWTPGNPFLRGTSFNVGLKSFSLVTRFDDALFWIGQDGLPYITTGGAPTPIATPAVQSAIELNTPTHCFFYEDRGHKFCVIRFSDAPAWVFDLTTREWHERAESINSPWRATCSIRGGSGWLLGNNVGGVLDLTRTNQDIDGLLTRTMVSKTLWQGQKFTAPRFEVKARVGDHNLSGAIQFALSLGPGVLLSLGSSNVLALGNIADGERDAYVKLDVSNDGGRTWMAYSDRSIGRQGDFRQRMVWRSLGHFEQLTVRLTCSEPADISFNTSAVLEVA